MVVNKDGKNHEEGIQRKQCFLAVLFYYCCMLSAILPFLLSAVL